MKNGLNTTAGFYDLEGNHLSIHWNPIYKRFSIGITDPWGSGTNSIELGYDDLRSLFKESEEIFFQHGGLTDERSFPKSNAEDK